MFFIILEFFWNGNNSCLIKCCLAASISFVLISGESVIMLRNTWVSVWALGWVHMTHCDLNKMCWKAIFKCQCLEHVRVSSGALPNPWRRQGSSALPTGLPWRQALWELQSFTAALLCINLGPRYFFQSYLYLFLWHFLFMSFWFSPKPTKLFYL